MASDLTLLPGDVLKIERRYLVDGVVKTVTDKGRFAGVQIVGSAEHIVIEDRRNAVRMFPLHAVSAITLVEAVPRAPRAAAPSWDPGVA